MLASEAAVSASSEYTYDAVGRTVSTVRTGPGGGGANYSYTSAGRLSGASWSTGMQVAYSYNQVGELTAVTPSGTGNIPEVTYGYDPSGRVTTVTRQGPAPVTTAAVYDAAGQLSSLEHSTTAGVAQGYAITRDNRGNPTRVDTTTSAGTTSALYTYDVVSRLRAECYPVTGEVCVAKSPRNAYTYDLVGNRATQTSRTLVGTRVTTVVTDYTYDAAYQLLTESVAGTPTVTNTWSPNGALATSTTPSGTQTYITDLTDELISLGLTDGSTVGYTHDAQGNRTSRTVDGLLDATWAWDDLSSLPMRIGEYDATGTLSTAWLADPTSSTGASLAQTSGGVSSWLLSDPFANTVATVSTTGNTVSGTRTMDAFGVERTSATGSLADAAVGFAGQYLDDATGLYDMRARDYDPTSGRFNATDPIAVPTGMPFVAGYSYSYNNPLMFTDVTGNLPSWNDWYNSTADIVNGAASFGNAVIQNPLATGAVAIGTLLMIKGSTDAAVGGVATVMSGGSAGVVTVPVAGVGVIEILGGATLVAVGGVYLVEAAAGDCSVTIMEHRSSGGDASSPGGTREPIGTHGTKTKGSIEMASGKGRTGKYWRIDVENPAPGARDGQMHVQGDFPGKIQYNFQKHTFEGMEKWLREVATRDPKFARGIKQGLKVLGMGG